MNPETKINILSSSKNQTWVKAFIVVLKRYLSQKFSDYLAFETYSFSNFSEKNSYHTSPKFIIVLDAEEDNKETEERLKSFEKKYLIYYILLYPISLESRIKGNSNYCSFYYKDKPEKRLDAFQLSIGSPFWVEFIDIVNFLKRNVDIHASKNIVIAWSNDELRNYRKLLASELQHKGYEIQLLDADMDESYIESVFFTADYIIHLFGGKKSDELMPSGMPAERYQLELAQKFLEKNKNLKVRRIIWENPVSKDYDEENYQYLDYLSKNDNMLYKADYLKIEFSKLKSLIMKTIKDDTLNSEFALYAGHNTFKVLAMYQNVSEKEKEIAAQIEFNLSENIKLLNRPDSFVAPVKYRQFLVEADILVVFYFDKNPNWLKSKIIDIIKSKGYGRKKEWLAKYLVTNNDFIENIDHDFKIININKLKLISILQLDLNRLD